MGHIAVPLVAAHRTVKKVGREIELGVRRTGSELERTARFFEGLKPPKPIEPPPVPSPQAVPEVEQEEAGDIARRAALRRSGRAGTIFTGALVPPKRGKRVLG